MSQVDGSPMLRGVYCFLLFSCFLAGLAGQPSMHAADQATKVHLPGPRKPIVEIVTKGDVYEIHASMRSVTSFTKAVNQRLSREKLRTRALTALGKQLSGDNTAQLHVCGAQILEFATTGERCRLVLRIPKDQVSLVSKGDREPPTNLGQPSVDVAETTVLISPVSVLFTRKNDYRDTIRLLGEDFSGQINQMLAGSKDEDVVTPIDITDVATTMERVFEQLAEQIAQDRLLLTLEEKQLLTEVEEELDRLAAQLRILHEEKPK